MLELLGLGEEMLQKELATKLLSEYPDEAFDYYQELALVAHGSRGIDEMYPNEQ